MPCQHWPDSPPGSLLGRKVALSFEDGNGTAKDRLSDKTIRYITLKLHHDGPLAIITLDRAVVRNRIDAVMAEELRAALTELADDDGLRLAILTAAGAVFSTGRAIVGDGEALPLAALAHRAGELLVASTLAAVEVPVIAALNGDATDHGLELALAADLRVAVPGARLGFSPPSESNFRGTAERSGCPGWPARPGPATCC